MRNFVAISSRKPRTNLGMLFGITRLIKSILRINAVVLNLELNEYASIGCALSKGYSVSV